MPSVDLIDETFLTAAPEAVAAAVHDPAVVASWWPDLELVPYQDRGLDGVRWTVTGALVGSAEVWCEAVKDGVLLHVYLRCDPTRRGSRTEPESVGPRQAAAARRRRSLQVKQWSWRLKDQLEAGRAAGEPRADARVADDAPAHSVPVAPAPVGSPDDPVG